MTFFPRWTWAGFLCLCLLASCAPSHLVRIAGGERIAILAPRPHAGSSDLEAVAPYLEQRADGRIHKALIEKDFGLAKTLLLEQIAATSAGDPMLPRMRFAAGFAAERQGDHEAALGLLSAAGPELDLLEPYRALLSAQALLALGRFDEALGWVERVRGSVAAGRDATLVAARAHLELAGEPPSGEHANRARETLERIVREAPMTAVAAEAAGLLEPLSPTKTPGASAIAAPARLLAMLDEAQALAAKMKHHEASKRALEIVKAVPHNCAR